MKKLFCLLLLGALVAPLTGRAQSSACQYSTCVPGIPFRQTDLLQIYGAIVSSGTGGGGGGTVTVSGTVNVTGNVGGFTTKYTHTIQTDGAYANGDCVGGILTYTNIFRDPSVAVSSGVLLDVEIWDNNNQNANLIIDFYSSTPTGTFNDNQATVINDPAAYLGTVLVSSADYVTTGTRSRASIPALGLTLTGNSGRVYATITTNGSTPTYGSNNTSLYLTLGVLQD